MVYLHTLECIEEEKEKLEDYQQDNQKNPELPFGEDPSLSHESIPNGTSFSLTISPRYTLVFSSYIACYMANTE